QPPRSERHPSRREILAGGMAATATAPLIVSAILRSGTGHAQSSTSEIKMPPEAFVYTELQISVPFDQGPWRQVNPVIRQQPGFLSKTWLFGLGTQSLGGFYSFDSVENAKKFVTGYFPTETRRFGVTHTTRVFDAEGVAEASTDMGSPYFGGITEQAPGAYVYTELQLSVPFERAPWQKRNPILKNQPGLLNKTWLSGLNNNSIGGFYAFETVEHAQRFALEDFPAETARLDTAYYARVFEAPPAADASRDLNSPYYS
ncbi:MAG: hypothetical protein ABJ201_11685, partial [Nisaea sp.]